jgi:hypothetical protein
MMMTSADATFLNAIKYLRMVFTYSDDHKNLFAERNLSIHQAQSGGKENTDEQQKILVQLKRVKIVILAAF